MHRIKQKPKRHLKAQILCLHLISREIFRDARTNSSTATVNDLLRKAIAARATTQHTDIRRSKAACLDATPPVRGATLNQSARVLGCARVCIQNLGLFSLEQTTLGTQPQRQPANSGALVVSPRHGAAPPRVSSLPRAPHRAVSSARPVSILRPIHFPLLHSSSTAVDSSSIRVRAGIPPMPETSPTPPSLSFHLRQARRHLPPAPAPRITALHHLRSRRLPLFRLPGAPGSSENRLPHLSFQGRAWYTLPATSSNAR